MYSQYSLERQLALQKSSYNAAAFAADPAAGDAAVSSVHEGLPNFFPSLPANEVAPAAQDLLQSVCYRCSGLMANRGPRRPVQCDICRKVWHWDCAGVVMPPRYGSWCCAYCDARPLVPMPMRVLREQKQKGQ